MKQFRLIQIFYREIFTCKFFKFENPYVVKRSPISIDFKSYCSVTLPSDNCHIKNKQSALDTVKDLDLTSYGSIVLPSFNFAAYADKSPLLQELIKIGVNLHKIENIKGAGELLIKLDFKKNVQPYLSFLQANGVHEDNIGNFITKNPFIFKEDIEDLKVRINYLTSKKFDKNMISKIISHNPLWLNIPVKVIDRRLGYIQETFNLKGDDVRKIITEAPSLATIPKKRIMVNTHLLREEMGLENRQLRSVIKQVPSVLRRDEYEVMSTFEFITKTMKIPLQLILKQPQVLLHRKFTVRERHKYLEKLGRAQYNPFLPGYIPLLELFSVPDAEFCKKFAKTSVLTYNEFLKTL